MKPWKVVSLIDLVFKKKVWGKKQSEKSQIDRDLKEGSSSASLTNQRYEASEGKKGRIFLFPLYQPILNGGENGPMALSKATSGIADVLGSQSVGTQSEGRHWDGSVFLETAS